MARATERKDINVNFSDYGTGTKLGFISHYFGWDSKGQHTGEDVEITNKYFNWLSNKALPQMMDDKVLPDEEVAGFVKYLKNIQDLGWKKKGNERSVAESALEFLDKKKITRQIHGKWKTIKNFNAEQLHEFLGGSYLSLDKDQTADLWNNEVKNFIRLKAKNPTSWKHQAQESIYKRYYQDESEFIRDFGSELKSMKSVAEDIKIPHSSIIRSRGHINRNLLKYGSTVLGLWAGYNMFFGSKISGNDDDYNTIEGLRHGGSRRENAA